MVKNILNLAGVAVLTKQQQKNVFGKGGRTVCTVICGGDSTPMGIQNCSNPSGFCGSAGVVSCKCEETLTPGPFDPPGGGLNGV